MLFLLLLAGCISEIPCITGDGNVIIEERKVEIFSGIELSSDGDLIIIPGDEYALKIEGEDNIVRIMVTRVKNGVLQIDFDRPCVKPGRRVNIFVTAKEIKKVTLIGPGSISSSYPLHTDRIETTISGTGATNLIVKVTRLNTTNSGSGTATFRGSASLQVVKISGSRALDSGNLPTHGTTVDISGAGLAKVNAK